MPGRRPKPARRRRGVFGRLLVLGGGLCAAALALLIGPALWIFWSTGSQRYDAVEAVPPAEVALVFGAGLKPDGAPSALLADRIHAAVLLFQAGKAKRLLLSGDGTTAGHDEPGAMARQAQAEGVPVAAIERDPGGTHTYASCSRAHDLFKVHSAIVVSQSYHLPRAIFTCERLGIRTTGFSLARVPYGGDPGLRARELLSLDVAWWRALIARPGSLI